MKNQIIKLKQKGEYLLENVNEFYSDLLGYKPEKTSLQQIPESQWNQFSIAKGYNPNSKGIYLPRNQTAIIPKNNPLSLFHEYFGHGLYCEKSLLGIKLFSLEKKLMEEEKENFQKRKFTLGELNNFRKNNKTFQKIKEFRSRNLKKYELFGLWTEYFLSGEFGLKEEFEKKYNCLEKKDKEIFRYRRGNT
jgi:hypothetical protein